MGLLSLFNLGWPIELVETVESVAPAEAVDAVEPVDPVAPVAHVAHVEPVDMKRQDQSQRRSCNKVFNTTLLRHNHKTHMHC